MRKSSVLERVLAVLFITCLITVSMFGCGGKTNDDKQNTEQTTEEKGGEVTTQKVTEKEKEPVHFTVLYPQETAATDVNKYKDKNEIYKKIVEATNVSFDILGWSDEKIKVAIAGGDIPDIVCVIDEHTKTLHDAGMLYDLETLIEATGSDLMDVCPQRIKTSKAMFGDGKLWYMNPNAYGPDTKQQPLMLNSVYPSMRWDYYKELGYPQIKNFDDLLSVLEEMAKKHPTTESGKKVYAMGSFTDWGGFWAYTMTTGIALGMVDPPQNLYVVKKENETITSNILSPESPIWQTALLMNKAQRKGLFHPDSFTMKNTDFKAAVLRGEILYCPTIYQASSANVELLEQGTEFIAIPFDFGYTYSSIGQMNRDNDYLGNAGWGGKNWSITTNCKEPERAMDLLNYCFSLEGSRLIKSGIEGVHWDYIDDEPMMKQEIIDLKLKNNEEWNETCVYGTPGSLQFFCGYDGAVNSTDGYPVDLINVPSAYKMMLKEPEKDFCEHYGVDFPMQEFWNRAEEGTIKFNANFKEVKLPQAPEDIKRINTKLEDMILKGLPRCIVEPTNDEEFNAAMNKLIEEMKAQGADESWEWAKEAFEVERAKVYGN
jgi:ABC-type glycerol-3-phosphate transport system substrate-binding protein